MMGQFFEINNPNASCGVSSALKFETIVISSSMALCHLPALDFLNVQLRFANNGVSFSQDFALLRYLDLPYLKAMSPSEGFSFDGEFLTIQGSFFSSGMICSFGFKPVVATVLTSSMATCNIPPHPPCEVPFDVLLEGSQVSSNFSFRYLDTPTVLTMYPSTGPVDGGIVISIFWLYNDSIPTDVACVFGNVTSDLIKLNLSVSTCILPSNGPGLYAFRIRFGNRLDFNSSYQFLYEAQTFIHRIQPSCGSIEGGTHLEVYGAEFRTSSWLRCLFSEVGQTLATIISSTKLVCNSPKSGIAGTVFFSVSFEEGGLQGDSLYLFYYPPMVIGINPMIVTAESEPDIFIYGSSFLNTVDLICKFGAVVSEHCEFRSSSLLRSKLPPASLATVRIAISLNSVDFSFSPVELRILSSLRILYVKPSASSASGGERLSIGIQNITNLDSLTEIMCSFNESTVIASSKYSEIVECVTPAFPIGLVNFKLVSRYLSSNSKVFQFQPDFTILSIQPRMVEVKGISTIFLFYSGTMNFQVSCRILKGVCTLVDYNSSQIILRVIPQVEGRESLEIFSNTSLAGIASQALFVHGILELFSVTPSRSQTNTHFMLTIFGKNFIRSESFSCKYGKIIQKAVFFSSSEARCRVSSYGISLMNVQISNNGFYYIDSHMFVEVFDSIFLLNVEPNYGFSSGGNMVKAILEGDLNTNSSFCVFGSYVVKGSQLSNSLIECATPVSTLSTVRFTVSLDGYSLLSSKLKFHFLQQPTILNLYPSTITVVDAKITVIGSQFVNGNTRCGVYDDHYIDHRFRSNVLTSSVLNCVMDKFQPGTFHLILFIFDLPVHFPDNKITFLDDQLPPTEWNVSYSLTGQLDVLVFRKSFPINEGVSCRVQGMQTHAVIVKSTVAKCTIMNLNFSKASLQFATNNQQFIEIGEIHLRKMFSIKPSTGPAQGGTRISITTDAFEKGMSGTCHFGNSVTVAYFETASILTTSSPPGNYGSLQVFCSWQTSERLLTIAGFMKFTYDEVSTAKLLKIVPSRGPVFGGVITTIFGSNFNSRTLVYFDGIEILSALVSSSILRTVTPKSRADGLIQVLVTEPRMEAQVYLVYEYLSFNIQIYKVLPTQGPNDGNTDVTLFGRDFEKYLTLGCLFGSNLVLTHGVSNSFITCRTPVHSAGNVTIDLYYQGSVIPLHANFLYLATSFKILSVFPSVGPLIGGQLVTITTSYYDHRDLPIHRFLECAFDNLYSKIVSLSHSHVSCVTPSVDDNKTVSIRIVSNKETLSKSVVQFRYQVGSIHQITKFVHFPANSFVQMNISVSDWISSTALCRFGGHTDAVRYGTVLSTTLVQCTSPPHTPGAVSLFLSSDGTNFVDVQHRVIYMPMAAVSAVLPSVGPVEGGIDVTIVGSNFITELETWCIFGESRSVGTVVSALQVVCRAPKNQQGAVSLLVDNGMGTDASSQVIFMYTNRPVLLGVHPSALSEQSCGSSLVTIRGQFTPGALECRFGAQVSQSTIRSSSSIVCMSPSRLAEGIVPLTVARVGETSTESNPIDMTVTGGPRFVSIEPSIFVAGTSTTVTVFGSNLNEELFCNFCGRWTPLSLDRSSDLKGVCSFPCCTRYAPSVLKISRSMNFGLILADFKVEYRSRIWISFIYPSMFSTSGGSSLTVVGENFPNIALYGSIGHAKLLDGEYLSSTSYRFVVPPYSVCGNISIQLSYSQIFQSDHSNSAWVEYFISGNLEQISPLHGPVDGGTIVQIYGAFDPKEKKSCLFGEVKSMMVNRAAEQYYCISPSNEVGEVPLQVSSEIANERIYGLFIFKYHENAEALQISPSSGPTSGSTLVNVYGMHLNSFSDWICQFGDYGWNFGTLISSSLLKCHSIPVPGPLMLSLAFKQLDSPFLQTSFSFTYFSAPKISSLSPGKSACGREQIVTVIGADFVDKNVHELYFGTKKVSSYFISSTQIRILVRKNFECGFHRVHLGSVQDHSRSVYELYQQAPCQIVVQRRTGNQVLISFSYSSNVECPVFCKFGRNIVLATSLPNASLFECQVVSESLLDSLEIAQQCGIQNRTMNCLSQNLSQNESHPRIFKVLPSVAIANQPLLVTVYGLNFADPSQITVSLKNYPPLQKVLMTSTQLKALIPKMDIGAIAGMVEVGTSSEKFDFQMLIRQELVLESIFPSVQYPFSSTNLSVRSSGFSSDDTVHCHFGPKMIVFARIVSANIVTCRVPLLTTGNHSFRLSSNWHTFQSNEMILLIEPNPMLFSASLVQESILSSKIMIFGKGFGSWPKLECFLAHCSNNSFPGMFISSSLISCKLHQSQGSVIGCQVAVVVDGVLVSRNLTVKDHYSQKGIITGLFPSLAPSKGGELIVVKFHTDLVFEEAWCHWSHTAMMGRKISRSTISCTSPAGSPGKQTLQISLDGIHFIDQVECLLVDSFLLRHVSHTRSLIYASAAAEFDLQQNWTCILNDTSVLGAKLVNRSMLVCQLPHAIWQVDNGAINIKLRIGIQNSNFRSNELNSMALEISPFRGGDIIPNAGRILNPTQITIFGINFISNNVYFIFYDSLYFQAHYLNQSAITATISASIPQKIMLSLIENGRLLSAIPFLFFDHRVTSVVPSQGPLDGGTVISIQFEGIDSCKIISRIIIARVSCPVACVEKGIIQFVTPKVVLRGVYDIQYSFGYYGIQDTGYNFEYTRSARIQNIIPHQYVMDANSLLTVLGTNFDCEPIPICSVGVHQIVAKVCSDDHVLCRIPSLVEGNYSIGLIFANGHFTISSNPLKISPTNTWIFQPTQGPWTGGTKVSMSFIGFIPPIKECIFGNQKVQAIQTLAGVECTTPPHLPGIEELFVSYKNTSIPTLMLGKFVFLQMNFSVQVKEMIPSSGPLIGNYAVTVVGLFLFSDLECVFGDHVGSTLMSSSLLLCTIPPGQSLMNLNRIYLKISSKQSGLMTMNQHLLFEYSINPSTIVVPSNCHANGLLELVLSRDTFKSLFSILKNVSCSFDGLFSKTKHLSSNSIGCLCPPFASEKVNFMLIFGGSNFIPGLNSWMISVLESRTIRSLNPQSILAGESVTLTAILNSKITDPVVCLIGNIRVPARLTDSSTVDCDPTFFSVGNFPVTYTTFTICER
eukprot:768768-Hanusia_phi.AAC.1